MGSDALLAHYQRQKLSMGVEMRRSTSLAVLCFAAFSVFPRSIIASGLDQSCLKSMDIAPAMKVTIGAEQMSCGDAERYRGTLFLKLDGLVDAKSDAALKTLHTNVAALEAEIALLEKVDSGFPADDVAGAFLATIGLTACSNLAAPACGLAIVGKVLANYTLIGGGSDQAARKKHIAALKALVSEQKEAVKKLTAAQLGPGGAAAVTQFNQLCATIRTNCLK